MSFKTLILGYVYHFAMVNAQTSGNYSYDVFTWVGHENDNPDYFYSMPWDKITSIGFFGDITDRTDFRDYAHDQGKKLVRGTNPFDYCDDINNETQRAAWIQKEIASALDQGYDGINIDYEGHDPDKVDGFNQAVVEACNTFHEQMPGSEVSIDAPFYPHYEGRNYDYVSIANACDYLFIMAYDGEFWDNIQCVATTPNCSMATAPLQLCEYGIQQYLALGVDPAKLYLGLPWYGLKYEYIEGIPFYTGQIEYKDIISLINDTTEGSGGGNLTFVDRGSVMRYQCDGFCSDDPKSNNDFATEIWFDNPQSLTPKYELAKTYHLKGVGMWEATDVDYTADGLEDAMAMWDPIGA